MEASALSNCFKDFAAGQAKNFCQWKKKRKASKS
jgi:hypothetical protein